MSQFWDLVKFGIVLLVSVGALALYLRYLNDLNLDPITQEAVVIAAAALVGNLIYDYFKQLSRIFKDNPS